MGVLKAVCQFESVFSHPYVKYGPEAKFDQGSIVFCYILMGVLKVVCRFESVFPFYNIHICTLYPFKSLFTLIPYLWVTQRERRQIAEFRLSDSLATALMLCGKVLYEAFSAAVYLVCVYSAELSAQTKLCSAGFVEALQG